LDVETKAFNDALGSVTELFFSRSYFSELFAFDSECTAED